MLGVRQRCYHLHYQDTTDTTTTTLLHNTADCSVSDIIITHTGWLGAVTTQYEDILISDINILKCSHKYLYVYHG